MIEKVIKPTSHAKASLCMFNAAICLDNYDLVKHSGYLVRDVRLKLFWKLRECMRIHVLYVFAWTMYIFRVAASEVEFN